MQDILKQVDDIINQAISDRRYLHQHAELNFNLPQTYAYIFNRLTKLGYTPTTPCECGILATVGKGEKCILLRADMDALPFKEENDLPFKSSNNISHCCGHDIHSSILLNVAQILKANEHLLNGCVKLMFQPNEEDIAGALAMKEAIFASPTPTCALALHVDTTKECSSINYTIGPMLASADDFTINISGKAGHGARPYLAINPLTIASHIYLQAQNIITTTDPFIPTVLTIGAMHGGTSGSSISDNAIMHGTIRTYSNQIRTQAASALTTLATNTAQALGGNAQVTFTATTPVLINDTTQTQNIVSSLNQHTSISTTLMPQPMSVSDDFAYIAQEIPTTFFILGAKDNNYPYSLHNPLIIFNEDCIKTGMQTLLCGIFTILQ